jgi:hypothetical protein
MKKGQVEIIGFMVIIILLFFGLIFYFKFANNDSNDLVTEAEQNLEVSNMLNAIKMQTICEGITLGDVIKTCSSKGMECGEDACNIVKREIPLMAEANGWSEDEYMFYIGEELYSLSTCSGNSFADSYSVSGTEVRLVFCYS